MKSSRLNLLYLRGHPRPPKRPQLFCFSFLAPPALTVFTQDSHDAAHGVGDHVSEFQQLGAPDGDQRVLRIRLCRLLGIVRDLRQLVIVLRQLRLIRLDQQRPGSRPDDPVDLQPVGLLERLDLLLCLGSVFGIDHAAVVAGGIKERLEPCDAAALAPAPEQLHLGPIAQGVGQLGHGVEALRDRETDPFPSLAQDLLLDLAGAMDHAAALEIEPGMPVQEHTAHQVRHPADIPADVPVFRGVILDADLLAVDVDAGF